MGETLQTDIAIIGGGPAGLAAAEAALSMGRQVTLFDAKPSLARKLLMAGKSGLNLTKEEPDSAFRAAFPVEMQPYIARFGAADVVDWATGLGEPVFTGTTGRVFPKAMKASPLLRKWLSRLAEMRVESGWRWTGWAGDLLTFTTPQDVRDVAASATILALGGASWARLGSDGAWAAIFAQEGIATTPFRPANMGFDCGWSDFIATRHEGDALKGVALSIGPYTARGDISLTRTGIESGPVYTLSRPIRDALEVGSAAVTLDLLPDQSRETIAAKLARPRGKQSLSNHLRKALRLTGAKAALLREYGTPEDPGSIKALPLPILRPRPLDEAISVAGGVPWEAVDKDLMLRAKPGVYVAGEMLDWEAVTGGYLITGCLATGRAAGYSAAKRR